MEVLGEPNEQLRLHPAARRPFEKWVQLARRAVWTSFRDIRQVRPDVDRVGNCYVFNLGGNKFRLITKIVFDSPDEAGQVLVKRLMTHHEYDKGAWKGDC